MEEFEIERLKGKNWVATLMLCWSLGSLGAHRFYTGKTTSAWIMFILTVTLLFSWVSVIWAFVDGILIALGHFKTVNNEELYERIPWLANLYISMIIAILVLIALVYAIICAGTSVLNSIIPEFSSLL